MSTCKNHVLLKLHLVKQVSLCKCLRPIDILEEKAVSLGQITVHMSTSEQGAGPQTHNEWTELEISLSLSP
jgi:hypothetical protein